MLWNEEALLVWTQTKAAKTQRHRHKSNETTDYCSTWLPLVWLPGEQHENIIKVNKHSCHMHVKLCLFYGSSNSYTDTHNYVLYIWALELLRYSNDLNMTPVFYFEECIHLCTNSSAGEGLGGTAGGSFLISTWGGTRVWSGTSTPTASLDVSWHLRSAPPRWTESEAVFVMGEDGVGSFCGEVEEGWEGGALMWGSG